ncbi:NAD(P)-dependent alcohol dehydrogenase [Lichenihabitans psoromatis]|uniref:NAD(P)-dependent alcohol dehydrogenase n=1 Tax=Lichenihabitans psoromatis TaxID=2528642 RepID=UPI0010362792|nr:NAD(P)-dependent alcohol dehydrogenase [Lichenihabitans psoromatis]
MKAVVYDQYGGPEMLRETSIDASTPKEGEVLVRVHATSVNGYDVAVRSGALKMFTGRKFPKRIGVDFAGEVLTAAKAASPFTPGDRVWGVTPLHQLGSAAELICVAPAQLAHYPIELDPAEAAALPVVGSTVITALRDRGKLEARQRLLVRGASGGVGSIAVQFGRALGAHVTGLAGASNLDFVREIGADEALDYAVTAPADLDAFDVILDTVGSNPSAWRRLLVPGGRMMAIVPDLEHPLMSMAYIAWSRVHGARRVRFFSDKPDTRLLTDLADYVRNGAIKPIVDRVYPMSDIAEAHRAMEIGGRRGKQVIRVV